MTEIGEFTGLVDSSRFDLKRRLHEELGNAMTINLREASPGMWVRHKVTRRLGVIVGPGRSLGDFLIQYDPLGKRRHKKRQVVSQHELERVPDMVVIAECAR